MFRKLILLTISTVTCFSTAVFAVGLGKSELSSGLNQPLKAKIQLLSVDDYAEHELQLTLANNEEFQRVGVDRLFFLNDIRFKTVRDSNGRLVVEVSTHETVKEPFLNFVVALNYPKGRFVKEYTFLLDPPVFEESTSTTIQQVETSAVPATQTSQSYSAPSSTPRAAGEIEYGTDGSTYGPVGATDTLWGIAHKTRPNKQVSIHQTLVAIYRANPDAFHNGNINNLLRGKVLKIPSAESISQVPHRAALQDVVLQNRSWKSGGARKIVDNSTRSSQSTQTQVEARLSLATQDSDSDSASGASDALNRIQEELVKTQEQSATLQAENEELRARLADLLKKVESAGADSAISLDDAELAALSQSQSTQDEQSSGIVDASEEGVDETSQRESSELDVDESDVGQGDLVNTGTEEDLSGSQDSDEISQTETTNSQQVTQPVISQPVQKAPPKLVTPTKEKGFFDSLMDNGLLLGGGIAAVVLIALAVFWRMRKRMDEEDFQDDLVASAGAGSVDATESFELPDVGDDMLDELDLEEDAGEESESTDENFDPLGEADIYIAYGKFEQAESLLKESIEDNPIRSDLKVKLMECYAESEDKDKFEALAAEVSQAVDAEEWKEQINSMREQAWSGSSDEQDEFDLPSTEDIFGEDDVDFESELASLDVGEPSLDDDEESSTDSDDVEEEFSLDDSEGDYDLDEDDSTEEEFNLDVDEVVDDELNEDDFDLDMDLGMDDELMEEESLSDDDVSLSDAKTQTFDSIDPDDFSYQESSPSESLDAEEELSLDEDELSLDDIDEEDDISLDDFDDGDGAFALDEADEEPLDLSEDDFSLDEDQEMDMEDDEAEEMEDEISTKLDLARAYIDMGDSDGAKEILAEVLADGNDEQKREAEELISKAD